jgi:alpha-amylase
MIKERWMQHRIGWALVGCLLLLAPLRAQEAAPWWMDTTWYVVFVRSFYDSDGDGIGDLRGLIEKLDYLNDGDPATTDDLGITGIWLLPVFEAASYHGYDALDYRAIEQDYGTRADFHALMEAAHARGIRVVVDMVVNHTSSRHPWFEASAARDPQFDAWYWWEDANPGFLGPWGERAWYQRGGRWYYAAFWSEMPDLNYRTPEVTVEMLDIAAFWLDEMGVDGFRMDAIKYVVEDEIDGRRILQNAPINRAWLADYNAFVKRINPQAVTIGEIWDGTTVVARYINEGSVDAAFEFEFAEALISGGITESKRPIENKLRLVLREYPPGTWASFTTNHDQARLLTQLRGDADANRVIAALLLTLPGIPFIYYGEEIGMLGDKPDELIRTPMQWDATPLTGGFTIGTPWQPLTPGFERTTVADQIDDPNSLLSHYRGLIHLRNAHSALRTGDIHLADVANTRVMSYLRRDAAGTFLVVVNVGKRPVDNYAIDLPGLVFTPEQTLQVVWGQGEVAPLTLNADGEIAGYQPRPTLEAYETLVIQILPQ